MIFTNVREFLKSNRLDGNVYEVKRCWLPVLAQLTNQLISELKEIYRPMLFIRTKTIQWTADSSSPPSPYPPTHSATPLLSLSWNIRGLPLHRPSSSDSRKFATHFPRSLSLPPLHTPHLALPTTAVQCRIDTVIKSSVNIKKSPSTYCWRLVRIFHRFTIYVKSIHLILWKESQGKNLLFHLLTEGFAEERGGMEKGGRRTFFLSKTVFIDSIIMMRKHNRKFAG